MERSCQNGHNNLTAPLHTNTYQKISISKQLEIVQLIREGMDIEEISKQYNIKKPTLKSWMKAEKKLLNKKRKQMDMGSSNKHESDVHSEEIRLTCKMENINSSSTSYDNNDHIEHESVTKLNEDVKIKVEPMECNSNVNSQSERFELIENQLTSLMKIMDANNKCQLALLNSIIEMMK